MCKSTALLKINGKLRDIDECIYDFVKLLNDNRYTTIASCCGHNRQPASIVLKENLECGGNEIRIMTFKQARKVDKLFPPIH